tara:strand:+ start:4030 stop:4245 length:216 start_codon:yes stop_codon:yes gene_type:complete
MGCDGCLKAATKRKPVASVSVMFAGDTENVITFDAHDNECIRRYFSRINKEIRAAQKAERDATKNGPVRKK